MNANISILSHLLFKTEIVKLSVEFVFKYSKGYKKEIYIFTHIYIYICVYRYEIYVTSLFHIIPQRYKNLYRLASVVSVPPEGQRGTHCEEWVYMIRQVWNSWGRLSEKIVGNSLVRADAAVYRHIIFFRLPSILLFKSFNWLNQA